MKKKWFKLVVAGIFVFGLVGCGGSSSDNGNSSAGGMAKNTVIDENNPPSVPVYPYKRNTPPSAPTQTN